MRYILEMLLAVGNFHVYKSPKATPVKEEHVLTEFDLARIKKAQEKRARKNELRLSRK